MKTIFSSYFLICLWIVIFSSKTQARGLSDNQRSCKPVLGSKRLSITCISPDNTTVPCDESVKTNTRALFDCNYPIYTKMETPKYTEITCINGEWDRKPPNDDFCMSECERATAYQISESISNGTKTTIEQYPWHAAFYSYNRRNKNYKYFCGGSLISRKVIVSAAHCFVTEDPKTREILHKNKREIKVAVGKSYSNYSDSRDSASSQFKRIKTIVLPTGYRGSWNNYEHDIAFVILQSEVSYSQTVQPICIDDDNEDHISELDVGTVVGFGMTEKLRGASETLLGAELTVGTEECPSAIYYARGKICASHPKSQSNTCSGDSGGGFAFFDKTEKMHHLRAVVSAGTNGPQLCSTGGYAVFTKFSDHSKLAIRALLGNVSEPEDYLI